MTTFVTSMTTTTLSLGVGEHVYVDKTGSILSNGYGVSYVNTGVLSTNIVENYSSIYGKDGGIFISAPANNITSIFNGPGGTISSGWSNNTNPNYAVFSSSDMFLTNYGQISADSLTGTAIGSTGNMVLLNVGSVYGSSVLSLDGINFEITNSGRMDASLGVTAGIFIRATLGASIVNTGTIVANIQFDVGGGARFDSSMGVFIGSIRSGSDNDVLVDGDRGTSINAGAGNDIVIGNGGDDVLQGRQGSDLVDGGSGNDTIFFVGGEGPDGLDGGSGIDKLEIYWGTVSSGLNINIASSSLEQTLADGTTLVNFEKLVAVGGLSGDNLTGGKYSDVLSGDAGNDRLDGGGGLDEMAGGDGSDTYFADRVTDNISETNTVLAVGGSDLVNFVGTAGTYVLGANIEKLTLGGSSAINGTGNALANTIIGNAAANTINGLGGLDVMKGGNGSDIYFADLAADVASESNAVLATGGNDLVNFVGTTGTYQLGNNVERLTLGGSSAINGTGNALANTLIGNSAANKLAGGLGNDKLTGGAGADFFLFNTLPNATSNKDTITDFVVGTDKIQLEDTGIFTALGTTLGTLKSTMFKNLTTGGAVDSTDRILYNDGTGAVFYDRDGSGTTYSAIQFATISGAPSLTHTSFIVI